MKRDYTDFGREACHKKKDYTDLEREACHEKENTLTQKERHVMRKKTH